MNDLGLHNINGVLRDKLWAPVIVTRNPFIAGRLRVFSETKDTSELDGLLSTVVPPGVAWDHNNPVELFKSFVLTSDDALRLIKIARTWRNLARASIAVSVGLAIALIVTIHLSGVFK